jgi:hypothetical protein
VILPVVIRRNASEASEDHTEVALILEPGFQTDLRDVLVDRSKQTLRVADPKVVQMGDKRLPGHLFEQVHEAA